MSRRRSSSDENPFAIAEKYYSNGKFRARTYSVYDPKPNSVFGSPSPNSSQEQLTARSGDSQPDATPPPRRPSIYQVADDLSSQSISSPPPPKFSPVSNHYRRASLDETIFVPQKYYIGNVDMTLNELLENEDTDHNYQITIDDTGPKVLKLGTANSNGYKSSVVRGNYMLSNLLQELTIAKSMGRNSIILDEERLRENPVHRMKRLITTQFWKNLTRRVTEDNIGDMAEDTKIQEDYVDDHGSHHTAKQTHRIYVPYDRSDQYEYFVAAKAKNPDLDVQYLPREFDADYILSLNKKPGLLALPTKPQQEPQEGPQSLVHWPYVVPGGRFNELYGWDSYMIAVGLLTEASAHPEHLELARGMTESFIYEIQHYGKILNANRSYYLGRSQPPFLTDMALRVFDKTLELDPGSPDILDFLRRAIEAAIKEYETVWVAEPRLDRETGLSCYHPVGKGVPPETESSQFNVILTPYSEKYNISQKEFIERYNSGDIKEPELDLYFLHDRGIRESGHDTSYRLEGKCAYLATVDLNSLLYKYEIDIAHSIKTHFGNKLETQGKVHTSELWSQRAEQRKANISHYLWNEDDSIFYDYHIKEKQQTRYESVTSLWPLWSRAATDHQASKLVENSVSKFEEFGGLVSGTLKSRGEINIHRPPRQWDYPYGWAPQQILAWIGLCNYHYEGIARRLAYRWLYLVTKAFVDYNGVVVEKYNMVKGAVPHKVDAEYGNQGLNFKGVAREGFGWVNASYLLALTLMKPHAVSALDTLTPPEDFLSNLHPSQRALYK